MSGTQTVVNVLYNAPSDPAAFEACYAATHLPLGAKVQNIAQAALIKCQPNADGSAPAHYRIAQLFFASRPTWQPAWARPRARQRPPISPISPVGA